MAEPIGPTTPFHRLLRLEFRAGRFAEFRREAAMGHEDDSNHRTYLFVSELRAGRAVFTQA